MKILLAVLLSLFSPGPKPDREGNNPESVIRRMIDCSCLEGHDQKVIGTMGDSAAVVLTKVLTGKTLSEAEMDTSVLILNMAFADPRMVDIEADRKPRTALFVLKSFNSSAKDMRLRQRIAQARKYIEDQFAKSVSGASKE